MADRSAFAGSVATADLLVRTMVQLADCSMANAVRMLTENPARVMGIADRKGSLKKGLDADVIIIDTAGRLHNKQNLMNELGKISRIVGRELPEASREVLLVLDGTTGQNGLIQAKQFKEIAGVTAMAVTKLDGTAKGGIVIAVADALQIPVKFVGVGEQADDLMPFEAESFVEALL